MDRSTEISLAKASYNWLKVSPILTVGTLFMITSFGIGDAVCGAIQGTCNYQDAEYISLGFGIFISALWHLILLQYVNNKESEFVRMHGQKALTQAGVRTGVVLVGFALDWVSGAYGSFACIVVIILGLIWLVNASQSKQWVEGKNPPITELENRNNRSEASTDPTRTASLTTEELKQILEGLKHDDDVEVFKAINKLEQTESINDPELKKAILKELESLADEDDNMQIRMDARVLFNRLKHKSPAFQVVSTESNMSEKSSHTPEEVLKETYQNLQSSDNEVVLRSIESLNDANFSSEAIRRQLELLALRHGNKNIRNAALAALDSAANRAVQKRYNASKLDRGVRYSLLQEITHWEKDELLDKQNADIIRRRYDYDFAPQTPPKPVPAQAAVAKPQAVQPSPAPAETPAPVPAKPSAPPEPRPTLLQTLTSEASIKVYLYLGAFFVIAAAAILGAVVPELRLPILMIGTLIFGGLSVAIKKRLPQPSFALFIVFSFLLPITANSLYETIKQSSSLTPELGNGYWAVVYFLMAVIWSGSTLLYESRFFSIAAFASLILSFFNIGRAFDAETAFFTMLIGVAALIGLSGTFLLKKWRDSQFALPLFLGSQLLQIVNLIVSLSFFGIKMFDPSFETLLHLFTFITWILGTIFYFTSEGLYPFFAFPWVVAATLVPMPWFIAAAFDLESLGSAISLFIWGALLTAASELLVRSDRVKKYSLPVLLASIPSLALAVFTGFVHDIWLGLVVSLGIAILFTILHILRTRWWLWALALFNGIIAYFAFFQLDFIQDLNIFFSYELIGITILFLLPDLLMKKDWKENLPWRLSLRIYGAAFLFITSVALLLEDKTGHIAIGYMILAVFCTIYALAYHNPYLGYIPAAYLPLAVVYALDAFNIDAWLPALTALAVSYYIFGVAIRKNEQWAVMLRNSGMALGVIVSFVALLLTKETAGWYTLLIALFFIAEMHIRQNGLFEIGAPILFTSGVFLILNDFNVDQIHYHLLAYSLVWVLTDLLNHLTFPHNRPVSMIVRGIGGAMAGLNMVTIPTNANSLDAALCFGTYTLAFSLCAFVYRKAWLGYIPAATLPLTLFFILDHFNVDAWLPVITGLAVLYFIIGLAIRSKGDWSFTFRNSALILGSVVSIAALITLKEAGGWYALAIGLLFIAEMSLRKNGWLEPGAPILFTIGVFLILHDFKVERIAYHLLVYSLIWLLADLLAHLAFPNPRPLKWLIRLAGGFTALVNYGYLFFETDAIVSAIGFGVYSLLFLTISLLYRQPNLLYSFTLTLPLFAAFLFRIFHVTQWIHPVIAVAVLYYAVGYYLRAREREKGWEIPLLYSGLGLGVFTSAGALILGGLDASIPVAIAATLWTVEAYAKKNAWLAFPANGLYLLSYFIILSELNVDEPQYYSMGIALFGLIQHYLLTRAQSKTGAFIMGMFSQFVLLGTTYIEMLNKNDLSYFFLLFTQSLVVLIYGLVIRSRSLTFFPIGFAALGVVTVVYSALKDIGTIFVIGCTGIVLLMLGVGAVLLRERIAKLGEKLSDWQA